MIDSHEGNLIMLCNSGLVLLMLQIHSCNQRKELLVEQIFNIYLQGAQVKSQQFKLH